MSRFLKILALSLSILIALTGHAWATAPEPEETLAAPQITSLSKGFGERGARLTVTGRGFLASRLGAPGTAISFDGALLPTAFVSDTELQFMVPTDARCGEHAVQAVNPGPSGQPAPVASNILTFIVFVPFVCDGSAGNRPPVAHFSVSPANAVAGQPVRFSDGSSDPDGDDDIRSWSWNFGDGTGSTEPNPVHIFRLAGTYHIRMVVKDSAGQKGSSFLSLKVTGALSTSGGSEAMLRYDTNNNLLLDDFEFFLIVDSWLLGEVDNSLLFKAVDLWVLQSPLTAARERLESAIQLQAELSRSGLLKIQARSWAVGSLQLEVFSLDGTRFFYQQSAGSLIQWHLAANNNRPAANGVLICKIVVRDSRGRVIATEMRRLILLR